MAQNKYWRPVFAGRQSFTSRIAHTGGMARVRYFEAYAAGLLLYDLNHAA
jgi:hypothetical protein